MYIFQNMVQINDVTKNNKKMEVSLMKKNAQQEPKTQSMKAEIANEFGVQLGADATARQNGSVGGEITKRLVSQALNK